MRPPLKVVVTVPLPPVPRVVSVSSRVPSSEKVASRRAVALLARKPMLPTASVASPETPKVTRA